MPTSTQTYNNRHPLFDLLINQVPPSKEKPPFPKSQIAITAEIICQHWTKILDHDKSKLSVSSAVSSISKDSEFPEVSTTERLARLAESMRK